MAHTRTQAQNPRALTRTQSHTQANLDPALTLVPNPNAGKNFVHQLVRKLAAGEAMNVPCDQVDHARAQREPYP